MNAKFLYKSKGYPFNALEVKPEKPTNKWLLMFYGTGQLGPADGSQIGEMDDSGFQRNLGFETEFNILSPQAVGGYSEFEFTILPWMVKTYGPDIEIVLTGHSLGARQVMEFVNRYRGLDIIPQVKGFMPIAGEMSGPYALPCASVDLPTLAVHGDKDTSIGMIQSKKFVDLLNKCPERKFKAELDIVLGANHGSVLGVVFAFNKETKYYRFIMSCFSGDVPTVVQCTAFLDEVNMEADFLRPDLSTVTYGLVKPD